MGLIVDIFKAINDLYGELYARNHFEALTSDDGLALLRIMHKIIEEVGHARYTSEYFLRETHEQS